MIVALMLAAASIETDMLFLTTHHFPSVSADAASVMSLYIPTRSCDGANTTASYNDAVWQCLDEHFKIEEKDTCNATFYVGDAAQHHRGVLRVKDGYWDDTSALMSATRGTTLTEATIRVIAAAERTHLCDDQRCRDGLTCYTPASLPSICVPDPFNIPTEDGVEGVVLALTAGVALVALVATNIVGAP